MEESSLEAVEPHYLNIYILYVPLTATNIAVYTRRTWPAPYPSHMKINISGKTRYIHMTYQCY